MRDDLAERLLAAVMGWEASQITGVGSELQMLAAYKYDRYGGFRPGQKFLESLASWLWQFPEADRERALDFVLQKLVFISSSELGHVIEIVYPDFLRPRLIARAANDVGYPRYRVAAITAAPKFRILQRRTLVLGLSDGSRLDLLRKACPELSHEQFWLTPDLGEAGEQMVRKLDEALNRFGASDVPRNFVEVVLVEDFSGSGMTLLRPSSDGASWEGKLDKVHRAIGELTRAGTVAEDARVVVLLYLASSEAERHLRAVLNETRWHWDLQIVQPLSSNIVVHDHYIISLCQWFFDPILEDEHKGRSPLGYSDGALPLILEHNTPNNSICLLWADTSDVPAGGLSRHALFPRFERHHKDRP
jgi:hypothetical protein